ncbi:MAG: hypothetical protein AAF823_15000 [Planctomycetota bacterium]
MPVFLSLPVLAMLNEASWIEYAVIGAYLLVLVGIGLVVKRFNSDDSDYFRSGCMGTWWLVGASAFMVQFSAWTFTGAAGAAYTAGWSVMIIFVANAAGYALGALVMAPWFRQLRVVTVPEAICVRFGVSTQQFYAWISVVIGLLYASIWLYGLAIFCSAVFGFEVLHVILVIGAVVLVYSTAGGSWAVMVTDFLQTLILFPITVLVALLCLIELGGVGGMFAEIQQQGLSNDFALINEPGRFTSSNDFTYWWAAAFFLKQLVTMNTLTSSQRYFAVKTGREARKAAAMAGVLMLLGACIWFIPPITGRLLFAEAIEGIDVEKPAEASYAVVSTMLLPTGLIGLMVVAMLSATMSSMDSGLNRNAAIFVRDIYPAITRLLGHTPDSKNPRLRLAQASSFGFGLAIIALAAYFAGKEGDGVFDIMLDIGSMLALPMAIPMILALFIRKAPRGSAIVSVAVAFVVSAMGFYSESLFGEAWTFGTKVYANTLAGAVGFVATMPFWRYSSDAYRTQVDAFFERVHRPIDFENEVGPGNDASQLRLIGGFAVLMGALIAVLLIIPNPISGRLAIAFVAITVAGAGVAMLLPRLRAQPAPRDPASNKRTAAQATDATA